MDPVTVIPDNPAMAFHVALPRVDSGGEKIVYTFLAETGNGDIYEGTRKAALQAGDMNYLLREAIGQEEHGCDILLFGHTHVRYNAYEDGIYILNPGSASAPHDGTKPSFGHIDISDAGIVMNIADISYAADSGNVNKMNAARSQYTHGHYGHYSY